MVEGIEDIVEGGNVARAQSAHQGDFAFPLHKETPPCSLNRDSVTFHVARALFPSVRSVELEEIKMRGLGGAGYASLLGLLICIVPAVVGAWFAFRPSERLLTMMRP